MTTPTRRDTEKVRVTTRSEVLLLGTVQRLTLGRPGNKVKDGKYFFS